MDRLKIKPQATPLMVAVGPKDKENLSTPDKLKSKKLSGGKLTKKTFARNVKNSIEIINSINNMTSDRKAGSRPITAEDLTTTGNPGEAYWEQLSESRRVALEAAWKENVELSSKVMELEYENTRLKAMLDEAKTSIKLLTELLGENESGDEEYESDGSAQHVSEHEPDTTLEDASFTSL